jgi:adenylate cyclase class IV
MGEGSANQQEAARFLEIEHKFLVPHDFDPEPLFGQLHAWEPERTYTTEVDDTYYLLEGAPGIVYRHRLDAYLQQLTIKSLGGDNQSRTEVNLELSSEQGSQEEAVRAFLAPLGVLWSGTLHKSVQVFYFPDVEIVYYRARYGGAEQACIEIEARAPSDIDAGLTVLSNWEKRLGLDSRKRCPSSILELLILPQLPANLRQRLQKFL